MTPYIYSADGSKHQDNTVGCAFLAEAEDLSLRNSSTVFASEIIVTKEEVVDALR